MHSARGKNELMEMRKDGKLKSNQMQVAILCMELSWDCLKVYFLSQYINYFVQHWVFDSHQPTLPLPQAPEKHKHTSRLYLTIS